jgi:hypothetical protein
MNPIENLLIRCKKQVQFSLLAYSAIISPVFVDQLYIWVTVILDT